MLHTNPLQKPTKLIRKAPVQRRAVESVSPTFFRGLLLAFPLTTAIWIALFLIVGADI